MAQLQEIQDSERLPFINIRPEVMRQLKISANEYMVLDTVYHLSRNHGYCYKTLGYMAKDLCLAKQTLHNIIDRLLQRGLLGRSAAGLTIGDAYTAAAYIDKVDNRPKMGRPKMVQRPKMGQTVPKMDARPKSTPKNYNRDIQENNNNTLVDSDKPNTTGKSYKTIFYELIQALGFTPQVKLTQGRARKLATRLKRCGYDQLHAAAVAIGQDGYLQGDNPQGKRYGDIDYLLRSDEIVDKYSVNYDSSQSTFDYTKEYRLV